MLSTILDDAACAADTETLEYLGRYLLRRCVGGVFDDAISENTGALDDTLA